MLRLARSLHVSRYTAFAAFVSLTTTLGCGGPKQPESTADIEVLEAPVPAEPKKAGAVPPSSSDVKKGTARLEANDFAGAKTHFEAAVAANPRDAEAHYYLGVVAEKQGDKGAAATHYKSALGVRPDFEAAAINASALSTEAKRYDEALGYLNAARAQHPESGALWLNTAVASAESGNEKEARHAFEEAVKRSATDPMVHFTHAHWLREWKDREKAIDSLKKAEAAAKDDVGLLAGIGDEYRSLGAFPECVSTFDKAVAKKDVAELRTERALCKLGAKDDKGAFDDLQAATVKEPRYAPAQFYLGGRFAAMGKWKETIAADETYLRLDPKGPMAKTAAERVTLAKKKATGAK